MHNELLIPLYQDLKLLIRKVSRTPRQVLLRKMTRDLAVIDRTEGIKKRKKDSIKEKLKKEYQTLMSMELKKSNVDKLTDYKHQMNSMAQLIMKWTHYIDVVYASSFEIDQMISATRDPLNTKE